MITRKVMGSIILGCEISHLLEFGWFHIETLEGLPRGQAMNEGGQVVFT